jgi:hypothetical protein
MTTQRGSRLLGLWLVFGILVGVAIYAAVTDRTGATFMALGAALLVLGAAVRYSNARAAVQDQSGGKTPPRS